MSGAAPEKIKPANWNSEPLPHVKRIIAVASGKGGVGKSTTAVNLAHALCDQGKRVGILDADIHGPSIPRMMGIQFAGQPEVKDDLLIPITAHGIKTLSMGNIANDQATTWRGPMVTKALVQMLHYTRWGTEDEPMDVLFIDMPPGTGDIHLTLMQQVPVNGAIIVTTPQEVATLDAYKCLAMFKKIEVPVLGVIENMSYFEDPAGTRHAIFGEGGGEKLAAKHEVPFLGSIALDPAIGQAVDGGLRAISEQYEAIAKSILS